MYCRNTSIIFITRENTQYMPSTVGDSGLSSGIRQIVAKRHMRGCAGFASGSNLDEAVV